MPTTIDPTQHPTLAELAEAFRAVREANAAHRAADWPDSGPTCEAREAAYAVLRAMAATL